MDWGILIYHLARIYVIIWESWDNVSSAYFPNPIFPSFSQAPHKDKIYYFIRKSLQVVWSSVCWPYPLHCITYNTHVMQMNENHLCHQPLFSCSLHHPHHEHHRMPTKKTWSFFVFCWAERAHQVYISEMDLFLVSTYSKYNPLPNVVLHDMYSQRCI